MRNIFKKSFLLASAFVGFQAFAGSMTCTIGEAQYNRPYKNYTCFTVEFGSEEAATTFSIKADKPVSYVIWGDVAASCGVSASTSCQVMTTANKVHAATATILFQDGSWEKAWATSLFNNI
ncbi:hypothetical protein [Pseudoalteromonas xiamenensis]